MGSLEEQDRYIRLMDVEKKDSMFIKNYEYDNKFTTANNSQDCILIKFEVPKIVEGVRFSPINADNRIKRNHTYQLFVWTKEGWKLLGQKRAKYEFIVFENVPKNQLYWIKDIYEGKEEMPFIIQEGIQKFIYYDIIQD